MEKTKKSPVAENADFLHVHAAKCNRAPSECGHCVTTIKKFAALPLTVLSQALADVRATGPRAHGVTKSWFSLGSVAISNFVTRTSHNCKGPNFDPSGRAGRDCKANGKLFKGYVAAGGVI